jgi:hypothetical protein
MQKDQSRDEKGVRNKKKGATNEPQPSTLVEGDVTQQPSAPSMPLDKPGASALKILPLFIPTAELYLQAGFRGSAHRRICWYFFFLEFLIFFFGPHVIFR